MRELAPIFHAVGRKVQQSLIMKANEKPTKVDMLSWMTRLSLELVGKAGLGYTFDDLTDNSVEHPYEQAAKQLAGSYSQNAFLRTIITPKITTIGSPAFRKFVVEHMPLKFVQEMRRIVQVMHNTSIDIFKSKKALIHWEGQNVSRNGKGSDIITALMRANVTASTIDKLADDEVISHIKVIHTLALHQDVQVKLREEIRQARKISGEQGFTHDEIMSLPLLDAVIKETLRLYPPTVTTQRTARRDTVLPLATPIQGINGDAISHIDVPKGTTIVVSIIGSNRNQTIWGVDSQEWKPERWLQPLPESLINARVPGVYSHMMTFLAGVRACVGFKFAELEMKVVLALLVEALEFSLGTDTIIWHMNAIAQPYLESNSNAPTMPILITVAKA
ncbi:Cytochrome P450 monooxygenase 91 [Psilocybe cubensis]|uniref:Cytochrome P450 monooxygenase 91 n=1 Tax=Psilocybe cubensis TaxID=181762 RepID=A0ACB8HEN9_PSICU|nr:Cytochrome P450 monooxygenase 91 [Psilocybe cubensis]KAH9485644.1 Cytochrome P450 monooxygenase 91 [Psilocybe cubensis]